MRKYAAATALTIALNITMLTPAVSGGWLPPSIAMAREIIPAPIFANGSAKPSCGTPPSCGISPGTIS
jgi:hypothetical protein